MRLGILADTHDELARTQFAVEMLRDAGAEALVHCGDLAGAPIVEACSKLPLWFVFGNHDADSVPELRRAAADFGAVCLGWGGVVDLAGRRIGVAHGHLTMDVRRVLAERPDFLLTGHAHYRSDAVVRSVRQINPGALYRAEEFTVALLDLASGSLRFLPVSQE
ncbi:MAG TPA: metallophosphoesterase family protein [Pirellulales bacterium]|nr:metallophosphoesterase family protein [Pirellulales bacterium]